MFTQKSQKVANLFSCLKCNYTTCKKNDYDKHLLTLKHKMFTNIDTKDAKLAKKKIRVNAEKNINIAKAYIFTKKHVKIQKKRMTMKN